jgi:hypothetical protein
MNEKYIPDVNPEELTSFQRALVCTSFAMQLRILESVPRETRLTMIRLQEEQDWRFGLDVLADKFNDTTISLVGVGPDGTRKVFAHLAQGAPRNAH